MQKITQGTQVQLKKLRKGLEKHYGVSIIRKIKEELMLSQKIKEKKFQNQGCYTGRLNANFI